MNLDNEAFRTILIIVLAVLLLFFTLRFIFNWDKDRVVDLDQAQLDSDEQPSRQPSTEFSDLTRIEGVGPKIAKLLNDQGVKSYQQLATTSVKMLNEILEDAGSRFSMHDPGSWPQQARLASESRWEDLGKMQEHLRSGK